MESKKARTERNGTAKPASTRFSRATYSRLPLLTDGDEVVRPQRLMQLDVIDVSQRSEQLIPSTPTSQTTPSNLHEYITPPKPRSKKFQPILETMSGLSKQPDYRETSSLSILKRKFRAGTKTVACSSSQNRSEDHDMLSPFSGSASPSTMSSTTTTSLSNDDLDLVERDMSFSSPVRKQRSTSRQGEKQLNTPPQVLPPQEQSGRGNHVTAEPGTKTLPHPGLSLTFTTSTVERSRKQAMSTWTSQLAEHRSFNERSAAGFRAKPTLEAVAAEPLASSRDGLDAQARSNPTGFSGMIDKILRKMQYGKRDPCSQPDEDNDHSDWLKDWDALPSSSYCG